MLIFDYFHGDQADQFSFIRIPRKLMTDKLFADLSPLEKMLYALLLDRISLSSKNGWIDEQNRVYIIYQISDIMEDLGLGKKKAMDLLAELESFGLVEKQRRGRGLPNILYVKSFLAVSETTSEESETTERRVASDSETGISDNAEIVLSGEDALRMIDADAGRFNGVRKVNPFRSAETGTSGSAGNNPSGGSETCTSGFVETDSSRGAETSTSRSAEIDTSRSAQIELPEVPKRVPLNNKTYMNKTYMSDTTSNPISSTVQDEMRKDGDAMPYPTSAEYKQLIEENIGYRDLLITHADDIRMIDGIVDLILETVLSADETMLIASRTYPSSIVRSKFLKLNYENIEYVLFSLSRNTTKIKNIKKYLLAALFNAPSTMDSYYQAEVRHDMAQGF